MTRAVDLPTLTPALVADDEELTFLLETWAANDPHRSADEIECFETALRASLDAERWSLASRLLGLVRAAADDRLVRVVRHAFDEGRQYPFGGAERSS